MCSASKTRQFAPNSSTLSLDHNINSVTCSSPNGHRCLPEFVMSRKKDLLLSWKFELAEGMFFLLQQHLVLPSRDLSKRKLVSFRG